MRIPLSIALTITLGCAGKQAAPTTSEAELATFDAEVTGQALDHASLSLGWELTNPGATDAKVEAATWSLRIENMDNVEGSTTFGTSAPAGGKARGVINLDIPLATTDEAFAARAELAALKYVVQATFKVTTASGPVEFEADWHGDVFPSKRPSFAVTPEAGRYGDQGLELNFLIGVRNPNPFPVNVGGVDYVLSVGGSEVGRGTLTEGQKVQAASIIEFNVARFLGKEDHHDLAKKLLKQKSIPWSIEATMTVDASTTKETLTGTLEFAK